MIKKFKLNLINSVNHRDTIADRDIFLLSIVIMIIFYLHTVEFFSALNNTQYNYVAVYVYNVPCMCVCVYVRDPSTVQQIQQG